MIMKMRNMMKRKNGQKGFTLIELIVVMAILAILAAIAVPRYTGVMTKAKADANTSNILLIERAADLYCSAKMTDLDSIDTLVSQNYLKEVPKNPVTGSTNGYTASATYTAATGSVSVSVGTK